MTPPPYLYRVEVPAGRLGWLTDNQRLHWADKAGRVRAWRLATYFWARHLRLPRIEYARIVCELRFVEVRRRDPNNWAPTGKACVDGLVDAGVFADDNAKHVIGPDMRLGPLVARKDKGLHLLIYPLEK